MAPLTRRRKAARDSSQEVGIAPPKPSPSKSKRKSSVVEDADDSSDSPEVDAATPKRQKLAVRVRDEQAASAETPTTLRSKRSREALIADSAEEDSDEGEPTPYQVTKQLEEDASQQLKQELKAKAAAPKSKRIVFGGDADVEKYVAAAARKAEKVQPAAVEEDEDSDDDAPEAVSASAAAEESKKAAQVLVDAAEKQAATTKRKRQERDTAFKQQAQKRKRAEKPTALQSRRNKKAETGNADEEDAETSAAEVEKTTTGRRRAEKYNLPDILPAELLTDSEDESEDGRDLRMIRKPKKITFDDAVQTLSKDDRGPRDEIVGSTAYRVMADQSDQKLAPRANHNSKSVKEMLIRRRRVGAPPNKANGFFKRK